LKVVYISSNRIKEKSGGGIESRKIYLSIKEIAKGNNIDFKIISPDNNQIFNVDLKIKKNRFKDILARIFFHSSYIFIEWPKIKRKLLKICPDILILGNSRMGFIAEYFNKKKENCYIIGHFDNVELDYVGVHSFFSSKLLNQLYKYFEKISVKRDEKKMVKNMNLGLFLTKYDAGRTEEIYNNNFNYEILPVCIENKNFELQKENKFDLNLVFLGSLWYESNVNAVKWFMKNVWTKLPVIKENINFIIGGKNPSKSFISLLDSYDNIQVFPDFDNKYDIIPENSVFISPVQQGAGMKIKIAEALEMGLPVIASEESLKGYEKSFKDKINDNIIKKSRTPKQYIESIMYYKKNSDYRSNSNKARQLFESYYSLSTSRLFFNNLFKDLRKKL